jgi:hygromycin-B 7''-O-kinase
MSLVLPQIKDRNHYKALFADNRHWDPAIAYLIEKHHLTGEVKRGVLGSHIVYRVGDCWIKLMAPIFAADMAFELSGLRTVEGRLSVSTPRIMAEGELEGWAYVILSHVDGEAIRNVWPKLDDDQKKTLTEQIATITRELSACRPDAVIEKRFNWNEFIQKQYDDCEIHQRKMDLPATWLSRLRPFLATFEGREFQTSHPVFLHADLTFDHFLVTTEKQPRISGLIDMADCQVGHFEYELVAPAVFLFSGKKTFLRHYLLQCGFSESQLNQRFSEKLLVWSILHRYFSLIGYYKAEMDSCRPGDFSALAKKIFPLTDIPV